MRSGDVGRRVVLLVVLLGAVALFAAVSFMSVTYWYVNTTAPLVAERIGNQTGGDFVKADTYYDPVTGVNVLRIYVTGIPGEALNLTDVLRMCNSFSKPIKLRISRVSLLQDYYPEVYIKYMAVKIAKPATATDNKVVIQNEVAVDTTTDFVTLAPSECAVFDVDIIIDAGAPLYKTLAAYQINIEKVPER